MKLKYGEVVVGPFDDRNAFGRWCRERAELAWREIGDPDADPPPLVMIHMFDPVAQEHVTHIHAPEVAWFMNMSRRHELAERIGLMCDLAPVEHVAWMLSAVELRHKGGQQQFDRHHGEILAMYGTLTNAWKAGVENIGEVAQVAVASIEGPTAWTAAVVRDPDELPRLDGWMEADDGSTDGPLIDPIQEAMAAYG